MREARMTDYELVTRRELERIESRLAWLTAEVARATGTRDRILAALLDLEGAHDKRPVAVR